MKKVLVWLLLAVSALAWQGVPAYAEDQVQIRETEHFAVYYYPVDETCVNVILGNLESNYPRIVSDLKPDKLPKIVVRMYPDLKTFHAAIGVPDAPEWVAGVANGSSEFWIVSPLNPGRVHTYDEMAATVPVHEFTHCVVRNITGNSAVPRWLGEAVALYETNQTTRPTSFTTLAQLNNPNDTAIYTFGYSICEFIVSKWGREGLCRLVWERGDIGKALDLSESEFQQAWWDFLRDRYGL